MLKCRSKSKRELKVRLVLEVLTGVKIGGQSCRNYGIRPLPLLTWDVQFLENAAQILQAPSDQHPEKGSRSAHMDGLAGGRQLLKVAAWAGISIEIGKGEASP